MMNYLAMGGFGKVVFCLGKVLSITCPVAHREEMERSQPIMIASGEKWVVNLTPTWLAYLQQSSYRVVVE
jgi:hypothetical protein